MSDNYHDWGGERENRLEKAAFRVGWEVLKFVLLFLSLAVWSPVGSLSIDHQVVVMVVCRYGLRSLQVTEQYASASSYYLYLPMLGSSGRS